MKAAPFDHAFPTTIEEACQLLADAGGGGTVIAGGQTLMPLLNLRMSQPFVLVDINRIAELKGVARRDGGTWIGPATRQSDALADATLARHLPVFVEALTEVGHYQTRNRGTVGGSIALGEPAAELPATAIALGATFELRSARGTRQVAAADFYVGPYMTVMEPDELLTGIVVPDWPSDHLTLFREVTQRPGDFALVGLIGALALDNGRIARAGIAWFGMGPTPIKARQVEQALIGQSLVGLDIDGLAQLAIADTAPFDDKHASAEYRRSVGRRIFARTLSAALDHREAA